MTAHQIARVCHEANRGYQAAVPTPGVPVAPSWDEFPTDQQAGVVLGVGLAMEGATPEQLHESWLEEKRRHGWTWGPVKDAEAKTHPCFVPYAELPAEQRVKDALFQAIVLALTGKSGECARRLEQFTAAAEKFVAKVESGRARSVETYADLKACLKADG